MQQSSRTAKMVAACRARASERDDPICNDPWARALAGPRGFQDAEQYERGFPFMELYVALRTAFLDNETRRFIARGFAQTVLLGAGFDTRAARFARPKTRFFEVDQPATQEDKLACLAALEGYPTRAAVHVPCDFARQNFVDALGAAGFRPDEPAFLIWEGVTYYLDESAVRATLRCVAERLHPRSVIAFDHVGARMGRGQVRDAASLAAHRGVARMGEPFRFGTDHALPMLFEEGFRRIRSTSFDEIALNLTGSYERARMFRFQQMVVASVAEDVSS